MPWSLISLMTETEPFATWSEFAGVSPAMAALPILLLAIAIALPNFGIAGNWPS